jgi:GT2 family glycosyltransferase
MFSVLPVMPWTGLAGMPTRNDTTMPVNRVQELLPAAPRRELKIPDFVATAWAGHSAFGYDLVRFTRPRVLVELGTHGGYSYFSFCHAAKDHGTGTLCHAVDTWQGDEHAGFYGDHIFSFVQNYNQAHFAGFSTLERMMFDDAAAKFEAGSIDVLHIDGLHTYEAVKHDWETWLPKVRPGGIVLFHDIAVRARGFGVFHLWEELSSKYPAFAFGHCAGLGVLCNGAVPADNPFLQLLFNGSAEERAALDAYYRVPAPLFSQMYWGWDGQLSEENSQKVAWASADEITQRFTFPAEKGPLLVRFDPARTPGVVEIASITVRHSAGAAPLLSLRRASDWGRLTLASNLVKIACAPALKLLSTGSEPQIILPALQIGEGGGTIECEIRLSICPGLPVMEKAVRQSLEGGLGMQVALGEVIGPSGIAGKRAAAIEGAIDQATKLAGRPSIFDGLRSLWRLFLYGLRRRLKISVSCSHIETPADFGNAPRSGRFTGWMFPTRGGPFFAVRARLGRHVWPGQYFVYRPDVAETFPAAGPCCGFTIPYELAGYGRRQLAIEALTHDGSWVQIVRRKMTFGVTPDHEKVEYSEWLQKSTASLPPPAAVPDGPLISVLMPVYNPPETLLRRAIQSVLGQTYRNWELCIADDASTLPHVRRVLDQSASGDPRIKVIHRPVNGHICAATNSALELATGEFTALLDHDDELEPRALAEVAAAITLHPHASVLYSDEDKIDERGRRYDPHFKPDWQPDLLLGQNYFSHLTVYRTALMREAGGFRPGYEGSQDWDLALRITGSVPAAGIIHIPQVLYHWRATAGSTALGVGEKGYSVDAARRALADHLARTGQQAELLPVPGGHWRVRHALPPLPPRVSIIIPTRNCAALLRTCVESLLSTTAYSDFEILVVDNDSDSPDALAYFGELGTRGVKVIHDPSPFNYSALNNRAVKHATGQVLAFLNNDLEVISPGWLAEMVSQAMRPGVGAVGAMLYYPDDRVQHAGVVLGIAGPQITSGVAGHSMARLPRGSEGYFNHLRLVKNYSAVTGACMVVRREIFERLGGFDETELAVAFNDVDFCLRALAAGFRNVWTPFAELYHHESASRGHDNTPEKVARFGRECTHMRVKWGPLLDDDPAYNPNLTLVREDFGLAWPPRPVVPARGPRFQRPA